MDSESEEDQEHKITIGMWITAFVAVAGFIGILYVCAMP